MYRRKLIALTIGVCGLSTMNTFAEEVFTEVSITEVTPERQVIPTGAWSYEQCVDYAIANNPDIRQTILSILQADEDISSAKDSWLPSVDFSTNHSFINYPSPVTGRSGNTYNSSYGINGSWTVWEGNVRKYRLESARLMRRQQQLTGIDQIKELKLSILNAYLNILYTQDAIEIARQTLEVSKAQAERTRKLAEAGRTSRVDLAQIESQCAQDEYALVEAGNNLVTNLMSLKKLLALRLDTDISVQLIDFPDAEITHLLPPQEVTYESAISWLPEFKSNEISREIYANDIKTAKAGRLPTISMQAGIGTGYSTGGPSWPSQMGHGFNEQIGISLAVPIFDANKTKRAVAKANLSAMEYDVNRDRLLDNLSQTIESLYVQARNSRARYESGKSRLEAMELTSTLVDRQFELGLVNPLDLLTAHNNLLSARLEQLQNKYMAILANKTIEFYNSQYITMP